MTDQKEIRKDYSLMAIKVKSWKGKYSHGWKILEKGFETKKELNDRYEELLSQEGYVEG